MNRTQFSELSNTLIWLPEHLGCEKRVTWAGNCIRLNEWVTEWMTEWLGNWQGNVHKINELHGLFAVGPFSVLDIPFLAMTIT